MKKGNAMRRIAISLAVSLVTLLLCSSILPFNPSYTSADSQLLTTSIRVKTVTYGDGSVKTLDLESEYLPVVVACENQNALPEAMRAQAVASRTYALYFKGHPLGEDFDLYDGEMSQVYNPGDPTHPVLPKHEQAVADTSGVVLKYNGSPICAFFVSGKNIPGIDETYIYVTNNEGKTGDDVIPSTIGHPANPLNRGCMGQIQADELESVHGYDYPRILKYFYGADIEGLSTTALDLVFAIDSSGSMSWNDPSDLRLAGSKMLVNGLDPNIDRVGVVSWDSNIDFTYPLSTDLSGAKGAIDNVDSSGGTNLNTGLYKAIDIMDSGKRTDAKHVIVFITDGWGTYTPAGAGGPAHDAEEKGYVIYAVGLAGDDDPVTSHLEDMASATGGEWFVAYSAEDLLTILDYIGRQAATTVHVEITPRSWNFNVLVVGCTAETQLIISNAEEEKDITIMDIIKPDYVELDAGCWFPWWCPAMPPTDLSPGESRAYSLLLDSINLDGIVDDTIVIKFKLKEGGEVQTVEIPVTGTVVCDPDVLMHYKEVAGSLSDIFDPIAVFTGAIDSARQAVDNAHSAMFNRATGDYIGTIERLQDYLENMDNTLKALKWGETLIWGSTPTYFPVCGATSPGTFEYSRYINGFNTIQSKLGNTAGKLMLGRLDEAAENYQDALDEMTNINNRFNDKNPRNPLERCDSDYLTRNQYPCMFGDLTPFISETANTIMTFHQLLDTNKSLVIIADSPVDLIVENPLGEVISKTINEILGSKYLETDVDGDGEQEDVVIIYLRQPGVYLVTPIPHEGTTPEETYSLGWISGDEKGVIVEGQPVGDIPADGFPLFSNETPSADANGPYTVDEGETVALDGTGSYDPDGDPLTYEWDLDNDGVFETPGPTPVFSAAGQDGPDTQPIALRVCDPLGECDTATGVININNVAPTVTISLGSQHVQYSDCISAVTFDTTDVAADTMTASSSWSVDGGGFTAGLPDFFALTHNGCGVSDGTNSCTWTLAGTAGVPQGDYTVRLTVEDDDGGQTVADSTITVLQEDATVTFDLDNEVAVQVDSPGGESSLFSLTVHVTETMPDLPDGASEPGDISLADVSMSLVPVGPGQTAGPIACTASVDGTGYDSAFTVTCDFDNVPVNTYSVLVTVGDGYYTGFGEDVLVVYDPSLGFTTGGGWFYWPDTDEKTNFGFTMRYNKKGWRVQGSLLLIRHLADGTIYRIKSNALYGLSLGESEDPAFGWASFSGKVTYREPSWPEPEGNYRFVTYVEDWNEPGRGYDQFWIKVYDKDNNMVLDMSMGSPAHENGATLDGGNIVVPHK